MIESLLFFNCLEFIQDLNSSCNFLWCSTNGLFRVLSLLDFLRDWPVLLHVTCFVLFFALLVLIYFWRISLRLAFVPVI